jgi:hypothetical protein
VLPGCDVDLVIKDRVRQSGPALAVRKHEEEKSPEALCLRALDVAS